MSRIPIKRLLVAAALVAALIPGRSAAAPAALPRYNVELVPVLVSRAFPALHSFTLGTANGKWLLLGGRTNGMHPLVSSPDNGVTPPPNAFPSPTANTRAWVIDPEARQVWSAELSSLPAGMADQLAATNAESYQEGDTLYIVGGYGRDSRTENMITFPSVVAVRVSTAIDAVINGRSLAPAVQQTSTFIDCPQAGVDAGNQCLSDCPGGASQQQQNYNQCCKTGTGWADCVKGIQAQCNQRQGSAQNACIASVQRGDTGGLPTNTGYYARVAGGGLEKLGDVFYLVFGQDFEGRYSTQPGDYGKWPVTQVYTQRVALLNLKPNPLKAAVLAVIQQDPSLPNAPYNRRDLNVLPALSANKEPYISVHGGVFVPGRDLAYRTPIQIAAGSSPLDSTVTLDASYQQVMSQYDCATLPMFASSGPAAGSMTMIFFGGISLYYLNLNTGEIRMDEGLPFIRNLTAMTRDAAGSWSEAIRVQPLASLMGADAKFVFDPRAPMAAAGILDLGAIATRTKVGYVFGGILADKPETTSQTGSDSKASSDLYEVWLDPTAASGIWTPALPLLPAAGPQ